MPLELRLGSVLAAVCCSLPKWQTVRKLQLQQADLVGLGCITPLTDNLETVGSAPCLEVIVSWSPSRTRDAMRSRTSQEAKEREEQKAYKPRGLPSN